MTSESGKARQHVLINSSANQIAFLSLLRLLRAVSLNFRVQMPIRASVLRRGREKCFGWGDQDQELSSGALSLRSETFGNGAGVLQRGGWGGFPFRSFPGFGPCGSSTRRENPRDVPPIDARSRGFLITARFPHQRGIRGVLGGADDGTRARRVRGVRGYAPAIVGGRVRGPRLHRRPGRPATAEAAGARGAAVDRGGRDHLHRSERFHSGVEGLRRRV